MHSLSASLDTADPFDRREILSISFSLILHEFSNNFVIKNAGRIELEIKQQLTRGKINEFIHAHHRSIDNNMQINSRAPCFVSFNLNFTTKLDGTKIAKCISQFILLNK